MEIIIEKSLVPIYEQIYIQIKQQIIKGDILSESELPSIRGLAKSIGVSVITVKKAYKLLLQDDLVTSVPGKGYYVCALNMEKLQRQVKVDILQELDQLERKAKLYNLSMTDIVKEFLENE